MRIVNALKYSYAFSSTTHYLAIGMLGETIGMGRDEKVMNQ